jgi:hypothetical protein
MDQKIKNFDRSIEQMMNENSVAPPFGMWNRISAELDAEVLPPVSSPASVIPGRAMIGFFAGALILGGTMVTAYLLNNKTAAPQQIVSQEPVVVNMPEKEKVEPVIIAESPKASIVSETKKSLVAKPAVSQIAEEKQVVTEPYTTYQEVAVPNQTNAESASASLDPYYFPPVDIDAPEVNKAPVAASKETTVCKPAEEETKVVEKKVKVQSQTSEKKLKFKKRRSGGFTYGHLNRLRSPR